MLLPAIASAHDFEVDGIYYNELSSTEVEVTFRGNRYDSFSNEYTGPVVIPEKVTYSGTSYSVTSIGENAFRSCTGLTSVMIPNSITSIGLQSFDGCSGLTGSLTIPTSVTTIGNWAFSNCSGLTSVFIPNSVSSIGEYAFYRCSGLTGSLIIPNSVTSIGQSAFRGCSGLTGSLTIPNSVSSIGDNAFNGCLSLIEITIEDGYTTLDFGSRVFDSVPIETLYVGRSFSFSSSEGGIGSPFYSKTKLSNLTISNYVTYISDDAFLRCSGLTGSLTIPNSVNSIGKSAFEECSGLTGSLTIPNSVTTVGDYAFYRCSGLTGTLTIGNSVTSIGKAAFSSSKFDKVICETTTPPVIGGSAAFSIDTYKVPLIVPNASIPLYKEAFDWKNFSNISSIVDAESITIENANDNKFDMKVGQSVDLEVGFSPEDVTVKTLIFESSDPDVATVDADGKITAIAPGTAEITITAASGVKTTVTVIVVSDVTTSVDEIETSDSAIIEVYNLQGIMLYKGLWSEARLSKGFYFVRQGYITRKIYVNSSF